MVILAALIASGALPEMVRAISMVASHNSASGQHAIDQPDPQRFRGIDPHARIHDQPRPGRPDQRDQMLQAVIAIGDAEFGGGNAELAVVGGDADVGQPSPPACRRRGRSRGCRR